MLPALPCPCRLPLAETKFGGMGDFVLENGLLYPALVESRVVRAFPCLVPAGGWREGPAGAGCSRRARGLLFRSQTYPCCTLAATCC